MAADHSSSDALHEALTRAMTICREEGDASERHEGRSAYAAEQRIREMRDSLAKQPSSAGGVAAVDLVARCREVVDWHNTGILKGNSLRALAEEWRKRGASEFEMLRVAESQTANEAMEFVLAAAPSCNVNEESK